MIERQVDECGYHHTTDSCRHRECGLAQAGQRAFMDFATDLHTDDQEEDGHQAVVDPEMQRLGIDQGADTEAYRRVPEGVIAFGSGRIRPDQCCNGGDQQYDAAHGFDVQKALEVCECALGNLLGTGHYMFLHGHKNSRTAARPA
ncbi:hypothetical protein D3C81_1586850 [compost metagenome]